MNWLPFLTLYILQLILSAPAFLRSCIGLDAKTIALYLIHNFTDVFLFWGVFLTTTPIERAIHMAFILITAAHWLMYGNRCIATVMLNTWCGYDPDAWLDSLLNRSGLRERSEYYQFLWLGLAFVFQYTRLFGRF